MADTKYAGTQFVVGDCVVEVYNYDLNSITIYKNIVTSARTKIGKYDNLTDSRITAFGSLFPITGLFRGWVDELDERTEEELKSDGCVLIHPDSESGYPKMYCGETDQFGIVPGSTCFGVKVFDRPGNSVSARVHTSDVWCSSETHYITPIITGDSDAADEFHTLGIAFAVVHPDGEIADVLSSYELGSFTLRTFDNSFWNGLAFGLRGVGVAAFKPSSSFERGYVAGSDLRNHRDMVSDENLEFGGPHYSYNGTELPILPANWDKEKYPYAIVLDMLGMKYLIVSSSLFATTGSGYTTTVTTDVAEYTFLKSDDKWRFDGYSTIEAGYNGYGTIKWSNTDIYKTDGSIYLAASDPVPVI